MRRIKPIVLVVILAVVAPAEAFALITGGEGNKPLRDPGWPKGAAAIFNHNGRVAWWEGPPFGGGQWHSECRGNAKALSAVLEKFARLDTKIKRIVVHDGKGQSFWIAPNNEPERREAARVDWIFMVWHPDNWRRLRQLPVDLNPTDPRDENPPTRIDVYTADLRWSDVVVPKGIEVIDERLESHGFKLSDHTVVEFKVTDLATKQPIAATIRIQKVEPRKTGGYDYPLLTMFKTDANGLSAWKNAPREWLRMVAEAEGFAPRVVAHARFDDQPLWRAYEVALSRSATVSGRVVDEDGKPLPNVDVSVHNLEAASGGRYESPRDESLKTDADGHFRMENLPAGKAMVSVYKQGYVLPGAGPKITTPSDDVALKMLKAASLRVTVDFNGGQRPPGYVVKITPEAGDVVGSYGGSGNINQDNEIVFTNIPPGRYLLQGRPNPGTDAEEIGPLSIELKGGQNLETVLKAK